MSTQSDSGRAGSSRLHELAVAIDRGAEVPIGLQLGWALATRIYDGQFMPGQRLPGLRELADAVGVNANTVRAVYQRLEHEGLIESRQGSGTFVAATLPRHSSVGTIAADAAREAHATGIHPREVAAALYVAAPPSTQSADAQAERRHQLRAQIAALERAIGAMEVEHPGLLPPPAGDRRMAGPTLLSAEELEMVRSELVRRLATVQAAIDTLSESAADQGESATATAQATPAPAAATGRKPADATTRKPAGSRKAKARPATAGA